MKTHEEIKMKAERLELRAQKVMEQWRQAPSRHSRERDAESRHLQSLPQSEFESRLQGHWGVHTHLRIRWIEMICRGGEVEFQLNQQGVEFGGSGQFIGLCGRAVMLRSGSAYNVLRKGYALIEEERLTIALASYLEGLEEMGVRGSDTSSIIKDIEKIVGAEKTSEAAQSNTKLDIVDLLDGRLEPADFITLAVDRRCFCSESAGAESQTAVRTTELNPPATDSDRN